jgi:hypothetical protein
MPRQAGSACNRPCGLGGEEGSGIALRFERFQSLFEGLQGLARERATSLFKAVQRIKFLIEEHDFSPHTTLLY